jgi:SAM-dependent methyltransferase
MGGECVGNNINSNIYYRILNQYQAAQLLFEAIQLDIFSYLNNMVTAKEIAAQTDYDAQNLELLLLALAACGYIEKSDTGYKNTEQGAEYLSKTSPHYLGETILFRKAMASLNDIGDKIRGVGQSPSGLFYDFPTLARVAVPEMYATGRVETFSAAVNEIFPKTLSTLKMLDLGGGSGVLAIEFSKAYPNSSAYIFEYPSVAEVAKEIVAKYNAENNVFVLSGDFNIDDIGNSYDLIVASGILDFAATNLDRFIGKIANALSANGYFLLIGRFSETEGYPQENILSWLRGYMNGVSPPPTRTRVETALSKAHMTCVRQVQSGRFDGQLYQKESDNG